MWCLVCRFRVLRFCRNCYVCCGVRVVFRLCSFLVWVWVMKVMFGSFSLLFFLNVF